MSRKKNDRTPTRTVHAAGAVVYRMDGSTPRVAVVHRPRYDDWSLPKGKVDPGESLPVTASRELLEETGFSTVLRRRLGTTSYPLKPHTRKEVTYWSAESLSGAFEPNDEVDELRWLGLDEATALVSYPLDRKILAHFALAAPVSSVLLLVRHAKAGQRSEWKGDDDLRPLDKNGRAQAELLAPMLRAFGALTPHSAPRVRCEQTLAPLADELGATITREDALSDEAWEADPDAARRRLLAIAADSEHPVVCSQGTAIPGMVSDLAARAGLELAETATKKAGFWALGFDADMLVFADYYPSPAALR